MGSSKKIAIGVIWTTLVNIINGIYGFISVPILIAYFGKSDYGLIGLAMSVNVYLRLMDMGLNSTNVRFFSGWIEKGDRDSVNKLFHTSLSFYGIIGLANALILLGISFFSANIFNLGAEQDYILKHLFYILAISAFISWFTSCFDQLIRANEYVGWTQKIGLIPKILQIIILFLTVTVGFSIECYYALTTFSMFIVIPICIKKIKKICPYISFRVGFDLPTLKIILPYSLNIFSFSIFQFSMTHLRPVLLGIQGTIESVADYRVVNGIITIVMMLGGAFLGVILPSSSKAVAKDDKRAQNLIAYDGTKYITITLAFCCFGVISVSKEILQIYVGDSFLYLESWLIMWLLITMLSHNQAVSSLILAGSDIRAITYCSIFSSTVGIISCWFLIPMYQIGGTIIGYGIYCIIQILFYYAYYWPKKMGIDSKRILTHSFLPPTVVGTIVGLLLHNLHIIEAPVAAFLTKGMLFAVLYALGTLMILTKNDKKFFIKLVKKK